MTAAISVALGSDAELANAFMGAGGAGSPAAEAQLCRRFGRRVRLYGRSRLPARSRSVIGIVLRSPPFVLPMIPFLTYTSSHSCL